MESKNKLKVILNRIKKWCYQNISCLCLVLLFVIVYILIHNSDEIFLATTVPLYTGENVAFYRYFTAILSHANLFHLIANSIGLLCISSILTPIVGRYKIIILFFIGIISPLSEVLTNIQYQYNRVSPNTTYRGGSSWGIFALYGSFLIVYPIYRKSFKLKWYRFDLLFSLVYFLLAGLNLTDLYGQRDTTLRYWFAPDTHAMGLAAGAVITFILVLVGFIKPKEVLDNSKTQEITDSSIENKEN